MKLLRPGITASQAVSAQIAGIHLEQNTYKAKHLPRTKSGVCFLERLTKQTSSVMLDALHMPDTAIRETGWDQVSALFMDAESMTTYYTHV